MLQPAISSKQDRTLQISLPLLLEQLKQKNQCSTLLTFALLNLIKMHGTPSPMTSVTA
jgi:hypothetical protein